MQKQDIEKVATDSYKTYFHDQEVKSIHEKVDQDIVLNKDKLTENVILKKQDTKKRNESLEVLREKLTQEAEISFGTVFHEEKIEGQVHKKTTADMYSELNDEKNHLSKMANDLKQKQMIKMKH